MNWQIKLIPDSRLLVASLLTVSSDPEARVPSFGAWPSVERDEKTVKKTVKYR